MLNHVSGTNARKSHDHEPTDDKEVGHKFSKSESSKKLQMVLIVPFC